MILPMVLLRMVDVLKEIKITPDFCDVPVQPESVGGGQGKAGQVYARAGEGISEIFSSLCIGGSAHGMSGREKSCKPVPGAQHARATPGEGARGFNPSCGGGEKTGHLQYKRSGPQRYVPSPAKGLLQLHPAPAHCCWVLR